MQTGKRKSDSNALVFKDFLRSPIFGVTAHQNEVECDGWIWKTGIANPLDESENPIIPCEGLSVEHAEIMFGLMTFQPTDYHFQPNPPATFRFSLKKLCEVSYGTYSQPHYKKAKRILKDLSECWGSVYFKESRETHSFRVLKEITIVSKPSRRQKGVQELWLDNVVLHESYQELLTHFTRQMMIDVNELHERVKGKLAKALYLFLPSRASHYTSSNKPFKIKLAKLYEQVGQTGIKLRYKSTRKEVLTRGKIPVIDQLNGVKIAKGTMYCDIRESSDEEDWMLCCWVEGNIQIDRSSSESKTKDWFVDELGYIPRQWAMLCSMADKYEWDLHQEKYIQKWCRKNHEHWLFKVYACALGDHYFNSIIAKESDGQAGIGAMTKQFRDAVLKAQPILPLG